MFVLFTNKNKSLFMKKISIAVLIYIVVCHLAFAQQIDMSKLQNIKARAIGPAGMSGRITAIDVLDDNASIIYIGSASGGVWKSESGGIAWTPIFDNQRTLSIGALAIQPNNPDVIWVGTGEGNPRNSSNGGYGIYKSIDGGKTWKLMGLEKTRNIHRIVIDKNNPDIVYVGAIGSPWGEHKERGVYKTIDGGKTWKQSLFVSNKTGCADLVIDPHNSNKIVAAMWEHSRKPWTFTSGGKGSGLYVTYDKGENWKKLTDKNGLPKGNLGRIGIAIAPNNPKIIYALIEAEKNALYKSDDGGDNWVLVNDRSGESRGFSEIGNRPFYYSEIYVDPTNENRIYSIFTFVNVSEDGGKTFKQLMPAYGNTTVGVHPDHHAFWLSDDGFTLIDGNDGGLNISHDRGTTWRFVENLPVGQFYHINVDNEFPYNVYGGMQDNGSWVGPAYVLKRQGIRNAYWKELLFGDGFDVIPDPKDSRYGYGMSQQGYVSRYDKITGNAKLIRPTHPDPDLKLRFNWNAAIAINPHDQETIYFGSQFIHQSTDKGHTWNIISPDLTTNNKDKQKQHESGGITMDATGAENHCTILSIAPSTLNPNILWVGTDDGNIQLTSDAGKTWTNLTSNNKKMPKEAWIPQITPSKYHQEEAFVVVNNYRQFDFKPYLFRTKNLGKTWENILEGKEDTFGYVLSFIQDIVEPNLMFLGTEYGMYVSFDEGKNWSKWTYGFPNVSTMDLVIHPKEHDLVMGTFGRAIYVLDDIRPLRAIAQQGTQLLQKPLKIFTPPTAYLTTIQQPSGTRFGANAIFNGENRTFGASFTYLFNLIDTSQQDKPSKNTKENTDSLTIQIIDIQERLVRTIKEPLPKEKGLHRYYWDLKEDDIKIPKRKSDEENTNNGIFVLPGIYKVKIQYKDHSDSTQVNVEYDPRTPLSDTILSERYSLQKSIAKKVSIVRDAIDRLYESKDIVEQFEKKIKKQPDTIPYKDALEANRKTIQTIDSLIDQVLGKEDKRQGITDTEFPTNISYLYKAMYYVGKMNTLATSTETTLIENADKKMKPVIDNINHFYTTDWQVYKTAIEQLNLPVFKEWDSFDY